jgi:hypothetical protein|uniref:Uncharacterized protein n=1 Tax=Castor canadensis TaxID=51338 RepID=A0A8C0W365_CASCN
MLTITLYATAIVHLPSPSLAISSQNLKLLSQYQLPLLDYIQGTGKSQVPKESIQSCWPSRKSWGKRSDSPIESNSIMERIKRGIIHTEALVQEGPAGMEHNDRS